MSWWTIHEDTIRDALAAVANGAHPEVVMVELRAGVAESVDHGGEDDAQ